MAQVGGPETWKCAEPDPSPDQASTRAFVEAWFAPPNSDLRGGVADLPDSHVRELFLQRSGWEPGLRELKERGDLPAFAQSVATPNQADQLELFLAQAVGVWYTAALDVLGQSNHRTRRRLRATTANEFSKGGVATVNVPWKQQTRDRYRGVAEGLALFCWRRAGDGPFPPAVHTALGDLQQAYQEGSQEPSESGEWSAAYRTRARGAVRALLEGLFFRRSSFNTPAWECPVTRYLAATCCAPDGQLQPPEKVSPRVAPLLFLARLLVLDVLTAYPADETVFKWVRDEPSEAGSSTVQDLFEVRRLASWVSGDRAPLPVCTWKGGDPSRKVLVLGRGGGELSLDQLGPGVRRLQAEAKRFLLEACLGLEGAETFYATQRSANSHERPALFDNFNDTTAGWGFACDARNGTKQLVSELHTKLFHSAEGLCTADGETVGPRGRAVANAPGGGEGPARLTLAPLPPPTAGSACAGPLEGVGLGAQGRPGVQPSPRVPSPVLRRRAARY